jgi:hypothetical protein
MSDVLADAAWSANRDSSIGIGSALGRRARGADLVDIEMVYELYVAMHLMD